MQPQGHVQTLVRMLLARPAAAGRLRCAALEGNARHGNRGRGRDAACGRGRPRATRPSHRRGRMTATWTSVPDSSFGDSVIQPSKATWRPATRAATGWWPAAETAAPGAPRDSRPAAKMTLSRPRRGLTLRVLDDQSPATCSCECRFGAQSGSRDCYMTSWAGGFLPRARSEMRKREFLVIGAAAAASPFWLAG